ncbi:SWIM zinc finger family protein [Thalassoglobus sp. JC818]|uniref:SWIM zinc finger family protein n=1 Tax=Thalassoglobus sp. JC818 TaxID=3232136 RepID=UPI003457CDA5
MPISLEQIATFAPDQKSVDAAKAIAVPALWQHIGVDPSALWGIFGRGSGYQVKIDLANLGAACGCPSRKYPCKHSLALLTVFTQSPDCAQVESPPEWVSDWIKKRQERAARQAETAKKPPKPVDRKAQAKRAEERFQKVQTGVEFLSLWLDDLMREGLAGLETKPFEFWDQPARRMVDSQAKGLASRLWSCAEIVGQGADWPDRIAAHLGRVKLLIHAFERIDTLSPDLQSEVRQLIGWSTSQEEIDAHDEKVHDEWFVLGQRTEEEERFRSQRSWLMGKKSKREALILQFAGSGESFPETIVPGQTLDATLAFYPGNLRQRARISAPNSNRAEEQIAPEGHATIDEFLNFYAQQLALNPWMGSCSCLLDSVTLTNEEGQWFVRDQNASGLPVRTSHFWKLLAESGGHPFQLFGEWNGNSLTPLGAIIHGKYRLCT